MFCSPGVIKNQYCVCGVRLPRVSESQCCNSSCFGSFQPDNLVVVYEFSQDVKVLQMLYTIGLLIFHFIISQPRCQKIYFVMGFFYRQNTFLHLMHRMENMHLLEFKPN